MRILPLICIVNWLVAGCKEPSNSNFAVPQGTIRNEPDKSSLTDNEKDKVGQTTCDFENGIHAATADYFNPKTGHIAKYELEVRVKDCKVIRIDFPNGGWLDEGHIPQAPINKTKEAVLIDDKGRQWKIHLH